MMQDRAETPRDGPRLWDVKPEVGQQSKSHSRNPERIVSRKPDTVSGTATPNSVIETLAMMYIPVSSAYPIIP